ncbi:MAG: tyrosine-type recombinase/integrase [Candidatus Sericytochromatia bacterium]|nr:tyrosine-type recombinase/integrase [Candidatus Sericytochromatia bacterium]
MEPAGLSPDPLSAPLAEVLHEARRYAELAKAANTRKAYQADWRLFTAWCQRRQCSALPAGPETVALYLTDHADRLKPATLQRHLATISQAHQLAGYETPTKSAMVRLVLAGIRREKGVAQIGKTPLLTADLQTMLARLPQTRQGTRDRALLLVGFAGAFRRSELVGLDVADVLFHSEGLVITLRWSKTDQEGQGTTVGIPFGRVAETCPVQAMRAWLDLAGISEGPVFRAINRHDGVQPGRLTDRAVALIVKRTALMAGLDPAAFAGHSLRAGLATQAAINGVSDRAIMKQTRHKTRAMVDRYVRDASVFRDNAGGGVGL